jgi:hypothetical protein
MTSFNFANITRTYNGKTGCACGCAGSYTEEGDTSNKVLKRIDFINKNWDRVKDFHWDNESCYEVENADGTRVTRIYVKRGA